MIRLPSSLLLAALLAATGSALAQSAPPPPPAAAHGPMGGPGEWQRGMGDMHGMRGMHGMHGMHGMRGMHGMPAMAILHHLDLTAEQRDRVRTIHEAAATDGRHLREKMEADRVALMTVAPTDPAYAATVAAAKAHAAALVDHHAALWAKVYAVLTPAQQAKVPELVKRFTERREKGWGGWSESGQHAGGKSMRPGMPMPPVAPSGPR